MKDTLNILSEYRVNFSTDITEIYAFTENMAYKQIVGLKIPKNCIMQTNRANYPTDNNTEDYQKLAVFIALLDNISSMI